MATVPYKDTQVELKRIKKNIELAYDYFRDNYDRFNDMRKFVFISSMTDVDQSYNKTLKRPNLEFPILETYISRLRGEFSKNEPSIEVSARDGENVDPIIIEVIEDHLRHILTEADKQGFGYQLYTDTLSGGFSAAKVYSDYTAEMSFHQDIFARRSFDPTMTFFDPMARNIDKGDGLFCGECFPMRKHEFEQNFPSHKQDIEKMKSKSSNNVGAFQWFYKQQDEQVIVVCDYYEKKVKREKIVMLANGRVMTMRDYKQFVQEWEGQGIIEQVPQIVGEPRMTNITKVVRYRVCDTDILEYSETDYDSLPLIFFDGNSILTKDQENSCVRQYTRPIIYQARGAQRLKNFAGQSLANELENIVQHKFIVAKESIPEMYKDAYIDIQQASTLVYNAFKDDDTSVPLPPPQAVPRTQIPPEISNTFMGCDQLIQNILGTFDPSLAKLGEREVSGIAIQESLSLSNANAMPYVVSYLNGLQAVANRILELIPKIYVTPRTIPIMTREGKKSYVKINQEGGISFDYDRDALQVKVEAGPSFGVQQAKALNQITQLMQISKIFDQFMNTKGLNILLDNVEIRNVEQLRVEADKFMQEMQQAQQAAAQKQSQQQDPNMMFLQLEKQKNDQKAAADQQRAQLESQKMILDAQETAEKLMLENKRLQKDIAELNHKIAVDNKSLGLKEDKQMTDQLNKNAELAMKASDGHHKKMMDVSKHIKESKKENENEE